MFVPNILLTFYKTFRRSRYLLRSYSGECLGSSSDEERSELRYSIWIAEFRELLDLWTHAAFWLTPVCSFTGVFNSFFRHWATNGAACSAALPSGLARQTIAGGVQLSCESTCSNRSGHPQLIFHSRILRGSLAISQLLWCDTSFIWVFLRTRSNWSYPLNLSI